MTKLKVKELNGRQTVGALSSKLIQKTPDSRDPIELERGLHEEFENNMLECIDRGKKAHNYPFFVTVLTKKEPLMPNVLREYFIDRQSCPTPEYDQAVYKIHDNAVEFLWVVPSKETCQYLRTHALEVAEEERGLLQYVLAFYDKRLYTWSLQQNNEICTKESVCKSCKTNKNQQILKTSSTKSQSLPTQNQRKNNNQIILQ